MKNKYHYPTLYNIKKSHQFIFSLQYDKKWEKRKKIKERKNKIGNILKEKKLKGKKLVVNLLGAALLCSFHGATVKNTLFEDGDSANAFRVFNPTQVFLHLKKKIYWPTAERGPIY
jgi:hypothetical protein